jgi:hypothetical protein
VIPFVIGSYSSQTHRIVSRMEVARDWGRGNSGDGAAL